MKFIRYVQSELEIESLGSNTISLPPQNIALGMKTIECEGIINQRRRMNHHLIIIVSQTSGGTRVAQHPRDHAPSAHMA